MGNESQERGLDVKGVPEYKPRMESALSRTPQDWVKKIEKPSATTLLILSALVAWLLVGVLSFGCSGRDTDYTAHMAFTHHILEGDWFPIPYSGIILSHVLAAALCRVFGITVSAAQAYLQTFSACLFSLSVLALTRRGKWTGPAVLLGFSWPMISGIIFRGYYAQMVSFGFYAVGVYSWSEKRLWSAWILMGMGLVTYPDQWIWLSPLLVVNRISRFGVAASALGLALMQFKMGAYEGGAHERWLQSGIYPLALLLFALGGKRDKRWYWPFWVFSALTLSQTLWSFYRYGHVTYYFRKNYYGLLLLLPWWVSWVEFQSIQVKRWLTACAVLFILARTSNLAGLGLDVAVRSFKGDTPVFDGADENCAGVIRRHAREQGCSTVLVIPGAWQKDAGDDPWLRAARVIGYNSWVTPSFGRTDFEVPILHKKAHDLALQLLAKPPISFRAEDFPAGSCVYLQGTFDSKTESVPLCTELRGGAFSWVKR